MNRPDDDVQFTRCWEQDAPRVAAYVRRHMPADDVLDVVSETFLHAWRRWDGVPQPPIPWLIGTARKVIGNQRRAAKRRSALQDRLLIAWDGLTPDQAATVLGIRSGAFRVRAHRARKALDSNTTELFVAATPAALNEGGIR